MRKCSLVCRELFLSIAFLIFSSTGWAQTLAIVVDDEITGTAPFNTTGNCATHTPGDDCGPDDVYVRTLDSITYRFDYSVNPAGQTANNVSITSTLPLSASGEVILVWEGLPVNCVSGGITNGGRTLTCNLGDVSGGTASNIKATARVLGNALNEEAFSLSAMITADNAPSVTSNAVTNRVSASPKLDVSKDYSFQTTPAVNGSGDSGLAVIYRLTVEIGDGKGSEQVTEDLVITDDLSSHAPNAVPYTFDGLPACGPNGFMRTFNNIPYGSIGIVGASNATNSVVNSGTWTCTQAVAGGPITITISGADTRGSTSPTQFINGSTIDADRRLVVSGYVAIWLPITDITDPPANGELSVTNTYANFDPDSVTGQSNYLLGTEPLANNSRSHVLQAFSGTVSKWYNNDALGNANTFVPSQSSRRSGDGFVMPTQTFGGVLNLNNSGVFPLNGVILCDKLDNTTTVVTDLPGMPGVAAYLDGSGAPGNFVIEYGTGNYTDFTDQRTCTCDDGDSPDGWFTTTSAVPGGLSAITKIRVRGDLPAGDNIRLRMNFSALSNPIGTILGNFAASSIPDINGGNWRRGNYNPVTATGNLGDRLTLTNAIVRVAKERAPDNSLNQALAGSTVGFRLNPTVTAGNIAMPPLATMVTLTDTLPPELAYVPGSASLMPDSVTVLPGGTTLVWNLGDRVPNAMIPPITFDTIAAFDAPNGTQAINTVVIESPDDGTPVADRTDTRGVQIVQSGTLVIFKEVDAPLIPINSPMTFRILYANVSASGFPSTDFIDVFPYNSDGRSPATSFNGTLGFMSASGANGETFLYSSAAPASINPDPNHPSNLPADSSSGWCTQAEFGIVGGCPNNLNEVRAIRVIGGAFPSGSPARTVDLVLNANGNQPGDIYTNRFGGRTPSLGLPVFSNDVNVTVLDPGDASIGDFVWRDLDGDGIQDAGEPGLDNVTIDLIDDANGNGVFDGGEAVLATQTTVGGAYDFTSLDAGNYLVQITDTLNILANLTLTGGSNPLSVVLSASEDFNQADFGYQQQDASIGDFVWDDLNGNGIQDAGEPGLNNVTLDLVDDLNGNGIVDMGEPVLDTQTTMGGGAYDFSDIGAGDYIVVVTDTNNVLSGFVITGGVSPTAVTGLTVSQDFNDADFGFQQQNATIGDLVWDDADGNGMQNGSEMGFANVTLDLIVDLNANGTIDGGEPVIANQTTNGMGLYQFDNLAAGNNIVSVTDTNNVLTGQTLVSGTNPRGLTLSAGQSLNTVDFGYQVVIAANATIGDFVWNDLNGDGVQDVGEPGLNNVTLDLITDLNGNGVIDGGEPVVGMQTTSGGGAYDFTGLAAGDYIVQVTDTNNILSNFALTGGTNPLAVLSLMTGQDFNNADFGYQQQNGTIGDFVWNDLNGDGVQDGGEPGLDNVTLNLIADLNGNGTIDGGEPVVGMQTTAGGGAYDFTGLPAGDYIVNITDTNNVLTDFAITGGANPTTVNGLTAGQDFNDADFGYQQQNGTIGDFVWNDLNGDGVQDGGEPGLDNVTLNLIADLNGNGAIDGGEPVLDTQTTAGGGAYDFTGLAVSDYIVQVTDTNAVLADYAITGGTDPAAVSLASGEDFNDADFGYQRQSSSIGDFVWNDLNGDGVQDAGEPGIDNVTLDLVADLNSNGTIDGGEPVLDTQTTAGGGAYDFTGLTVGDYIVQVTDTNAVLTDYAITGGTDPLAVSLAKDQDFNDADFGYQRQSSTIGDFLWNDLNGDGIQDAGEPGFDNVTLDLIDDLNANGTIDGGEPVLDTQTTAGGGAYDFTGLTVGDYIVQVTDTNAVLADYAITGGTDPLAVSLAKDQDYNDADFGYQRQSSTIGDFVWNDLNGDGVQDAGEPGFDNVTLDLIDDLNGNGTIDGGEPVLDTQTTAGGGAYDFTGLTVGDYIVQVTDTNAVLTDYAITGGTDPLAVSLAKDQDFNDADFGYQRQSSTIGDFVWNDLNGDGIQDAGEPGFDNVTLDLIDDLNANGTIDGGEPVLDTQTTAGGGAYDFTGLTVGDYIVQVTDTNAVLADYAITGGTDPLPVSLAKDQDYNDADFGYQRQSSTIGDFVWNDLNGDGVQDAGEPGFDNVTLDLIDDLNGNGTIDGGEPVLDTQTTAGGGAYDFTGLTVGDYIVQVTDSNAVLADYAITGGTDPLAVSLAKDQDYNDADFGYQRQSSSIGDFVWNDLNGDGVQDAGEPGFDNVTLDLIDDLNANGTIDGGEPVLDTQTTAGGGAYDFTGLTVGDYIVQVTDTNAVLADYAITGGTNPLPVSLAKDQDYNDADFGYQRQSSTIGDFVWNDLNGDGVQDAGEPGFDNVTLDLIDDLNGNGTIDGGEPVLDTQTTAGGGAYDFTGLTVGDYIVQVTDSNAVLADYAITGGTDPLAVSLAKDQDFNDADFGYQRQSSTIGNFVWNDLNGDGIQDAGEPGFDNVTLDLIDDLNGNGTIDGGEPVLDTQTTAGGGAYDFTGLTVGDYIVQVTDTNAVLADYAITGGTDPLPVSLAKDQDYNDADFGYQRVSASIGDFVWHDFNGDGIFDLGELGLDDVTLDLIEDSNGNGVIDAGEPVLDTQTTANGGAYDFTGLPIGDYIVQVTDVNSILVGFIQTTDLQPFPVTGLVKNQDFDDADFGYLDERATIGVSKDANSTELHIQYVFRVENFGSVKLFDLSMEDHLNDVFGAGNYQLSGPPVVIDGNATQVFCNPGFNGDTDPEIFAGGSELEVGEFVTIAIDIDVISPIIPNNGPVVYTNQVMVRGVGVSGNPVRDESTPGPDPDTNSNGNPGDDGSPTVVYLPLPVPTMGTWTFILFILGLLGMTVHTRRKHRLGLD